MTTRSDEHALRVALTKLVDEYGRAAVIAQLDEIPDELTLTLVGVEPSGWQLDEWFERFWEAYGKVGPRKKAHECFVAAVKRGHDPRVIVDGLVKWVRYWSSPGAAKQKWPQGFLNQDYFLDEPPAVRVERKAMPGRSGIEAALSRRERKAIGGAS